MHGRCSSRCNCSSAIGAMSGRAGQGSSQARLGIRFRECYRLVGMQLACRSVQLRPVLAPTLSQCWAVHVASLQIWGIASVQEINRGRTIGPNTSNP